MLKIDRRSKLKKTKSNQKEQRHDGEKTEMKGEKRVIEVEVRGNPETSIKMENFR